MVEDRGKDPFLSEQSKSFIHKRMNKLPPEEEFVKGFYKYVMEKQFLDCFEEKNKSHDGKDSAEAIPDCFIDCFGIKILRENDGEGDESQKFLVKNIRSGKPLKFAGTDTSARVMEHFLYGDDDDEEDQNGSEEE